jgi:hypothetical protein
VKRDMDLAREILFKIEESPDFGRPVEISIEGREEVEINYHVMLLHQAGLITGVGTSGFGDTDEWIATGMTWSGHEFLDAARENTRWNQAKEILKKRGSGMMFEVLKTVLVQLAAGNVTPLIREALQKSL